MNGIFNILKPSGMTSHDIVSFVRKIVFPGYKVGHTGTLDPSASGVLPVCTGKATRIASFFLEGDKGYRAVIKFGISTNTLDGDGDELHREAANNIDLRSIEKVLQSFSGEILQTPPAFSALKQKGKHLYELARKGEKVNVSPRKVIIHNLKIVDFFSGEFPELILDIRCSHGTYIRSIASDLGGKLNCGAHLSFLVRTSSGNFLIDDSITLNEFESLGSKNKLNSILHPIDEALNALKKITVKDIALKYLSNGNKLYPNQIIDSGNNTQDINELIRVYDEKGNFWGLGRWEYQSEKLMFKPEKLLREEKETY